MNMIRYAPWIGWRALSRVSRHAIVQSSSSSAFRINPSPSTASESQEKNVDGRHVVTEKTKSEQVVKIPDITIQHKSRPTPSTSSRPRPTTAIVHDLYTKYKENERIPQVSTSIHDRIKSAKTVESLLNIVSEVKLTRPQCHTILSTLADWSNGKYIKVSSFDSDPRYLKICKHLGYGIKGVTPKTDKPLSEHTDLTMILEVTGDDEASRRISKMTLRQTIKVMAALAAQGRRSLSLLQSLASNFGCFNQVLNMKEGADVLYTMSVLNFADATLLNRTCVDLCLGLKTNTNPSVVRSIVRSLGHLRYRHLAILDDLSEWYVQNFSICRPQDIAAILMTLAVLTYTPMNESQLFQIVTKELNFAYMPTPSAWLDAVWALVVLNQATPSHVKSVLEPEFQNKLLGPTGETMDLSISTKRKLLNINASAKLLIPNYEGPLLQGEEVSFDKIFMTRSREKKQFLKALFQSLSNLLPSNVYLNKDTDIGMGFLLDGECIIDDKLNPLPLSDPTSLQKGKRIAIFAWNYDDMCRGTEPLPTGHANLAMRLSKASGYQVLSVPFTEFNPQDKLITRVKYLEQQLKMIVTIQ